MDERFPYGPFHRFQSKVDNQRMEESGMVGGKAPRNIYSGGRPKVKAYVGPLPPGRTGIEFFSATPPSPQTPPRSAEWPQGNPGVEDLGADPVDGEEIVGIRVMITRRVD
jgi:hypothetical protein